ncbi:MAG: helix-turn-helix domain-containing protein [Gemmatimonadaceae bacterium]
MLDRIVFQSANVRVGAFRCSTGDPRFRDSGPIQTHLVVFPRTAVWIQHVDSRAFLADPAVVTIYNKGQEYTRAAVAPDGDRSDWFGVSPDVAFAIAHELDPRTADNPTRPYRAQWSTSDVSLYVRQRALFARLARGAVEPLEAEESVLHIVAEAIARSYGGGVRRPPRATSRAGEAHSDLVHRARAELARDVGAATDVSLLAGRLQVSPYHLCRVFRAITGTTLHAYRLDLRCRVALERLADPQADISRLALELGFSSHSHFTATMRRRFGATPSVLRRSMTA